MPKPIGESKHENMFLDRQISKLENAADKYDTKAGRLFQAIESMPGGKEHLSIPLAQRTKEFSLIYQLPKGDVARKMLILDRVSHGMCCEAERLRFFAARLRRQETFAPRFGSYALGFAAISYVIGFRSIPSVAAAAVAGAAFSYLDAIWVLMQHMISLYIGVVATQEMRSEGETFLWSSSFRRRAGIEKILSGEVATEPHLAGIEFDWRDVIEAALKDEQK